MKMKDIARLSGVTRQTVSAVLNDKSWVSDETRRRVEKVIEQHNYTPNLHATSLTGKATKLIGVILRDISNPFYSQIAVGIETVLSREGYSLLYVNTFEDHHREVKGIQNLIAYNTDGIIVTPILVGVDLGHLWRVKERNRPMVTIDRIPGMQNHFIDFDDEKSAYRATEHFIEMGHRHIGFLGGPETSTTAQARERGFRQCLRDHDLAATAPPVINAGTTEEQRYAAIDEMLGLEKIPSAILCFNDLVAINTYQQAHAKGLKIPDDLSLIGFDDIETSKLLAPPLTSVRLQAKEAGEAAAEMLLDVIKRDKNEADSSLLSKIFHPELIIRGSVAKR